jgi:cytochrome oxidase maturation protein, cbb3-type
MDSLYLLIPLAVLLVALAIWALFWAVRSGQYDDLDTESRRILFDDQDQPPASKGEQRQAKREGEPKP